MRGGMPRHACQDVAIPLWGWAGSACTRNSRNAGKSPRQKLHNAHTCEGVCLVTGSRRSAPPACPIRSTPWLGKPWRPRFSYTNHNKTCRSHEKSLSNYQSQLTTHLPTNHITYITISLTISHSHSILTHSILFQHRTGYNKKFHGPHLLC